MTHEQVEAIAQKHVNEVLAEINEKVHREKERIEAERIERETRAREKAHERELARERAAEEKAEKDRLKAEQKEAKAAEKKEKAEAKAAEKKKREDEKAAAKGLKAVTKEQAGAVEGVMAFDQQRESEAAAQGASVAGIMEFDKHQEKDEMKKENETEKEANTRFRRASQDLGDAVGGVLAFDREHAALEARNDLEEEMEQGQQLAEEDDPSSPTDGVKGIKGWFKDKRKSFGRGLSRAGLGGAPGGDSGQKSPTKAVEEEEDIYGEQVLITKQDSSKNVATAKPAAEHDEPVETKDEEPAKTAAAKTEDEPDDEPAVGPKVFLKPHKLDDDDDEILNDAEENVEHKGVAENTSMGLPARANPTANVSTERSARASRFKEEL